MSLNAILLDSREPPWVQALTFGDVPARVDTLTAGDAWLLVEDAVIVVERKTFGDLLGSIQDGRLFDQAARMVELSPWCYLVVQGWGELDCEGKDFLSYVGKGGASQFNIHRIEGALATVQQMGVVVIRIGPLQVNYHDALLWLASRKRGDVKITVKREAVMQSPGERILCALPSISEVRAQALLDHCGTAAWALTFLTGDGGGKIPGIGPATKAAARQALGLDDDQILAVNIKYQGGNK